MCLFLLFLIISLLRLHRLSYSVTLFIWPLLLISLPVSFCASESACFPCPVSSFGRLCGSDGEMWSDVSGVRQSQDSCAHSHSQAMREAHYTLLKVDRSTHAISTESVCAIDNRVCQQDWLLNHPVQGNNLQPMQ